MIKVYLPLYRSEIKEMLNEIEEITFVRVSSILILLFFLLNQISIYNLYFKLKS